MTKGTDLKDRVVLMTGATSGIGKVAARRIAAMGPRMVLVVRDQARGMVAWEDITMSSGNDKVELMIADLSSMEEVRLLAQEFKRKYKRLHVLVNNAAIVPRERSVTVEGLETQFAVNHMAYFLLTNLLLDVLKASAPARIINTASGQHSKARLDMDDMQSERGYRPMARYGQTKLMNMLFTNELSRRLQGTSVTVNSWTPGFTATGLGRDMSFGMRLGMRMFGKNPERAAETLVHLVSSPDVAGVSGAYFKDSKEAECSKNARDEKLAAHLWRISEELSGLSKRKG